MDSKAAGVIVSGVYGAGKSSVVEEMADILEQAGISYAAIDLDWLWWFDSSGLDAPDRRRVLWTNLSAVVGTYLEAGVSRFLMAWALQDRDDVAAVRAAVPFPVRVPLEVVRARLGPVVTTGRFRDPEVAERWLAEGIGAGFGDLEVDNDRPIHDVAGEILDWLGWRE